MHWKDIYKNSGKHLKNQRSPQGSPKAKIRCLIGKPMLRNGNPYSRVPGPPGGGLVVRPATYHCKKEFAKKSQQTKVRRKNGIGLRRRQRNTSKLNIGTWNVTALLKPGKMQELVEQITQTKLDIIALQEIRWSGNGIINKKDFTLYYSGSDKRKGQPGTGFLVLKKLQNNIMDFKHFKERMCKLRIRSKYNKITLISAYAPTEDKNIESKEQFYDDLEKLVKGVPGSDTLVILGDFNAQLGRELIIYRYVTGQHTLHEKINENGELLCQFATANDLIIMST